MTLTIEVPQDVAARIATLPEQERGAFAVRLLSGELASVLSDAIADALMNSSLRDTSDLEEDEETAIRSGIAEAEAGRTISLEDYAAEIAARRRARFPG